MIQRMAGGALNQGKTFWIHQLPSFNTGTYRYTKWLCFSTLVMEASKNKPARKENTCSNILQEILLLYKHSQSPYSKNSSYLYCSSDKSRILFYITITIAILFIVILIANKYIQILTFIYFLIFFPGPLWSRIYVLNFSAIFISYFHLDLWSQAAC